MFSTHKIRTATLHVSFWTLCSRIFGACRTVLQIRFLGASAASDGFITAYKIPNSLRKIFAEGAVSGIFVPTIVKTIKQDGVGHVNNLISLSLIIVESIVLALCAIVMLFPRPIIAAIAPGFSDLQVSDTISCLRIVMPFIFLISSSAIFAGALQAVGKFFMPAFAPVLLNIVFICSLLLCLHYTLPVEALCWGILVGGVIQLLLHILFYLQAGFGFGAVRTTDIQRFGHILIKFVPCLIGMGAMEVGVIVDQFFTSYLPQGSTSLHEYALRFMGIPLGVFASALSTVLLPHFSHVASMARERLSLYLLETTKLVVWAMVPVMLMMGYFAHTMLASIFLSDKFTLYHVAIATRVLQAFVIGLFFFAINKLLLNIFYALQRVWLPAFIILFATLCNALLNWMLVFRFGVPGVAFATSLSACIQTMLFYATLIQLLHISFDYQHMLFFLSRYFAQLTICIIPFVLMYNLCLTGIGMLPDPIATFCVQGLGFWFWFGPLYILFFAVLWYTRRFFKITLYFLE